MITNNVNMQIVDKPEQAPNYPEDWTALKITNLIIVGQGTEKQKPTVDIQMEDKQGNKFLVMTTGAIAESIGAVARGKRERDESMGICKPD